MANSTEVLEKNYKDYVLRPESVIQATYSKISDIDFTANNICQKINLIPTVYAAGKEDDIPKKPPRMKYSDLPIYESPHYEYKTYKEESTQCSKRNVKILHAMLYPIVHKHRQSWTASICGLTEELKLMKSEACDIVCHNVRAFKNSARDPANLVARQAVVIAGTASGVYFGFRWRGLSRKIIFGTIGALASGSLCFPDATDIIIRDFSYTLAKGLIAILNSVCNKDFKMRERLSCKEELPDRLKFEKEVDSIIKPCIEKRKKQEEEARRRMK